MFNYYGSKGRLAPMYPSPRYGLIVEPFGGSARYSLHHWRKDVLIYEKDRDLCELWWWLQGASAGDVMGLPVLMAGMRVSSLGLDNGPLLLLRMLAGQGSHCGCDLVSKWAADRYDVNIQRIARSLSRVRHWRIVHGDGMDAPDVECTWFIDPPYVRGGESYRHGSSGIDYLALGDWVRSRRGQVICCESSDASWLDFRPFSGIRGISGSSVEGIWTNEAPLTLF